MGERSFTKRDTRTHKEKKMQITVLCVCIYKIFNADKYDFIRTLLPKIIFYLFNSINEFYSFSVYLAKNVKFRRY